MKKTLSFLLAILLFATPALAAANSLPILSDTDIEDVDLSVFEEDISEAIADELSITAPSAILMEKETGYVIFEKNADNPQPPASVTKVMTILLIVEAIEEGKISLDDIVTTSTNASSMGGSQIFLKEGEQMTVSDMLKSIVVSSANDAAVAMAEHLSGTESVFVSIMNERAAALGMKNTTFKNCTGLIDDPEHLTTSRDIAIMSRELIRHDLIKEYTTIWMDTIRNGEFGLSNTNKLIHYYDGATGLKTGFTQASKYCLSATALRDGVEYIAVVMGDLTSADRFESAKTLLSFGFANYSLITTAPDEALLPVPVKLGKTQYVQPVIEGEEKLLVTKNQAGSIVKTIEMMESVPAPVSAGQKIGTLTISDGTSELKVFEIEAGDNVEKLTLGNIFVKYLSLIFTGRL